MAEKRALKELTVTAVSQLMRNMRRVTLQGEDLVRFPDNAEGAYIKLLFESEDAGRPVMRTYTQNRGDEVKTWWLRNRVDVMLSGPQWITKPPG